VPNLDVIMVGSLFALDEKLSAGTTPGFGKRKLSVTLRLSPSRLVPAPFKEVQPPGVGGSH